jgi:hypothetical protein
MSKLIVNVATNETIQKELSKADKDQQEIDEANIAAAKAITDAKAELKANAKAAAEAKLAALGLTTDDLRALGL